MSVTEALRYGATELKAVYNRNLGVALAISIGFHLVLIGLYMFSVTIGKAGGSKSAPIAKMKLSNLAPPPVAENTPPPPPPMVPPELQTGGSGGVAARAGTPIAVPDALISPDVKDFAKMTDVAVATPEGGDGTGFKSTDGTVPVTIDGPVEVKEKEKIPEPDEFIPVEEEAACDMAELQRRVKYPEIARRNGIEGTVQVRALVDKNGRVSRTIVEQSDNKALEDAAVEAVKATPFKPAIQNKNPVVMWVTIPVRFALN